jgi:DNA repair protein RecO
MLFEGIVINRVPYKERDLIVKLLLRNGLLGSFYIYGGQGGGKHHKPSVFEPGSMMKIQIRETKTRSMEGAELLIAQESTRLWEPSHVRYNIQAFYLMCLYFELVMKIAPSHQGEDQSGGQDTEGIFSVVSNALFHLEAALVKNDFEAQQHLMLFMVKLLFHMGIMPDTDHCGYCQANLLEATGASFVPAEGHFSCDKCFSGENEKGFLLRVKKGYQTRFQDYLELTGTNFQEPDRLIQYFCHQFHLKPMDLKSYRLLFKS